MNRIYKDLFKAPWSGQRVSPFFRFLSFLFFSSIIYVVSLTTFYIVTNDISNENMWFIIVVYLCSLYFLLFLWHIIKRGRAPLGWFPW